MVLGCKGNKNIDETVQAFPKREGEELAKERSMFLGAFLYIGF